MKTQTSKLPEFKNEAYWQQIKKQTKAYTDALSAKGAWFK